MLGLGLELGLGLGYWSREEAAACGLESVDQVPDRTRHALDEEKANAREEAVVAFALRADWFCGHAETVGGWSGHLESVRAGTASARQAIASRRTPVHAHAPSARIASSVNIIRVISATIVGL